MSARQAQAWLKVAEEAIVRAASELGRSEIGKPFEYDDYMQRVRPFLQIDQERFARRYQGKIMKLTDLTFAEAMEAALEGYKIARKGSKYFAYFEDSGGFLIEEAKNNPRRELRALSIYSGDVRATDWEAWK